MDLLRKEMERKKRTLAIAKEEAARTTSSDGKEKKRKYLRVTDLIRIEEREQEEKDKRRRKTQIQNNDSQSDTLDKTEKLVDNTIAQTDSDQFKEAQSPNRNPNTSNRSISSSIAQNDIQNSPASITRKLRQLGLVVRNFGEGNTMRLLRLKKALEQQSKALEGLSELAEFSLGKGHGIRNTFLERDNKSKTRLKNQDSIKNKQQQHVLRTGNTEKLPSVADDAGDQMTKSIKADSSAAAKVLQQRKDDEDQSDPPKFIYKYLKSLLKEWERELAAKSELFTRSVVGRNESKTLKQCKDYIRPLFKLLKSRQLEEGLQFHLLQIVNFAKDGEFVKAHDSYMDMAIGRAAWPIGVTMVGIHARSGRAKIASSNVAHVMNSELQRKYLTSVKRLLTFDQKRRVDVDPSKKVS